MPRDERNVFPSRRLCDSDPSPYGYAKFSIVIDGSIGDGPGRMAGTLIYQPAGDIEGAPRIVLFKNRSADGGRAFWNVIERETDHRACARQPKRCGAEMPGQPVGDARSESRPAPV